MSDNSEQEPGVQTQRRGGAGNVNDRPERSEQLTAEAAVAALHAGTDDAAKRQAPSSDDPDSDAPRAGEPYLIGRGGGGNLVEGSAKDKGKENGEEWKGWADILKERLFGK